MKLCLVLLVCCAASVLAAPAKDEKKESINVEVKPVDLQLKITPSKIETKLVDRKASPTTSTTEVPVDEPEKEEKLVKSPEVEKKVTEEKNDEKLADEKEKPAESKIVPAVQAAEAAQQEDSKEPALVTITVKPVAKLSEEKLGGSKPRRPSRGRARFQKNVQEPVKSDEKKEETKIKPEETIEPKPEKKTEEAKSEKEESKSAEKAESQPEEPKSEKAKTLEKVEPKPEKKEDIKPAEKEELKPEQKEEVKPVTKVEEEEEEEKEEEEESKSEKTKSLEKVELKSEKKDDEKIEEAEKKEEVKEEPKPSKSDENQKEKEEVKPVQKSRLLTAEERRKGRKYHDIQIVQLESEIDQNGKYRYNYEGEDGTLVKQEGELRKMGEEDMGESVKGSYSYKDDDGNSFSVTYTADENGYRPIVGEHIPTVPPAIARALAWAATAKPWVDPWMVEQEKLKVNRESRKLLKNEKKTKKNIDKD